MSEVKQTTKAEETLKRCKFVLQNCMNILDDAIAELVPIDKRGEEVQPTARAGLGIGKKRKR